MSPAARRVLIAEPHAVMRSTIRALFEKADWEVVGEACDGEEAVKKAKELGPELVVIEISMPRRNGVDAAAEILKHRPSTKLLAFSIHDSEAIREEVLRAGVHGYAVKSAPAELLSEAERLLRNDS